MNWKTFLLGTAAGFAAGFAAKQILDQSSGPSPDKVLAQVKETVKRDGNIYGSWILMKPEAYTKNELDYLVYKGGITRNTEGLREQFEFIADATTGTILELNAQND
ncbi:PepSY domain-containing protein [Peribacillus muralis]|uniref:PepSY domain-containing protein n=1 Tax=Peribacillus muralis TaxID=264697 RepID=UPI00070E2744|nr:PepSY domain-containing protein [Peribacillus muralis]MCK1991896.1 PepSY domain-containing protein [Peribacillus muralis]MCK2012454.1 PepSY domain-containing protein [Peribacillus muralis]